MYDIYISTYLYLHTYLQYLHRWLVPILATHVGALAGAWLYYLAVEANWPAEGDTVEAEAVDQVGS